MDEKSQNLGDSMSSLHNGIFLTHVLKSQKSIVVDPEQDRQDKKKLRGIMKKTINLKKD